MLPYREVLMVLGVEMSQYGDIDSAEPPPKGGGLLTRIKRLLYIDCDDEIVVDSSDDSAITYELDGDLELEVRKL